MKLTLHALERAKERLHLNENSLEKLVNRAIEKGIRQSDTKGTLKKYLDRIYLERKNGVGVIYGDIILIFSNDFNSLITLFSVPPELKKYIKIFNHNE